MPLFTCSNSWSDIPAASCCAWVCVLVVCSSCSWKGHKIPSCQGAGQGGPRLLLESSALVRFAASLCRGVLVFLSVRGLLSRLLLLLHSPGASSAAAPVRSRFLPALLAASRGTQCLATEGWQQGCTCLFCSPYGFPVSKDQILFKTIQNYSTVSQPCICYLHFCLVNNLQYLLWGILWLAGLMRQWLPGRLEQHNLYQQFTRKERF